MTSEDKERGPGEPGPPSEAKGDYYGDKIHEKAIRVRLSRHVRFGDEVHGRLRLGP